MGLTKRKFDLQDELPKDKVEGSLKDFMRKIAFDTEYVYEGPSQIKCEGRFYPNNPEYACAIYWLQGNKGMLGNLFVKAVQSKKYCYYSNAFKNFPDYYNEVIEVITNYALDIGIDSISTCDYDLVAGGFEIRFDMSNVLATIKLSKGETNGKQ